METHLEKINAEELRKRLYAIERYAKETGQTPMGQILNWAQEVLDISHGRKK